MSGYEFLKMCYSTPHQEMHVDAPSALVDVCVKGIKSHLNADGGITGEIVFDVYPSAIFLIGCQLMPEYKIERDKIALVKKFLEHSKKSNLFTLDEEIDNDLPILVSMAIHGVNSDMPRKIKTPLTHLFFAHTNEQSLKQADIFPSIEFLYLFKKRLMRMPPWAIPGVLSTMIILGVSKKKNNIIAKKAMRWARDWLIANMLKDGSIFSSFHQTALQSLALYLYGKKFNDRPAYEAGRRSWHYISSLISERGYVTRFKLPVWDTALSVLGLIRCYKTKLLKSADLYHIIHSCINYLLNTQQSSGGWAFASTKGHPPDNDTTAMALRAILEYKQLNNAQRDMLGRVEKASKTAADFLLKNQGHDGGWATYGLGNSKKPKGAIPSIKTDPWWMQKDASVADITGHVLTTLASYGLQDKKRIYKAIKFLEKDQTSNGYWYGRWGQTFIYATSSVLEAVSDYMGDLNVRSLCDKGIRWLESTRSDNGWGEDPSSYHKGYYIKGMPSVESTAWAITALSSYRDKQHLVNYLIEAWNNTEHIPSINVAAFDVYVNTIYPYAFTLLALSYCTKGDDIR